MLEIFKIQYLYQTQTTHSIFAFITGIPPCSTCAKIASFDTIASKSSKPDEDAQHFDTIGDVSSFIDLALMVTKIYSTGSLVPM